MSPSKDPPQPSLAPSSRPSLPTPERPSSYFTYPITYAVSGVMRRLNADRGPNTRPNGNANKTTNSKRNNNSIQSQLKSTAASLSQSFANFASNTSGPDMHKVFQPPHRAVSPFSPPPLTPLSLTGYAHNTRDDSKLLSRSLAEEIRLLLPARIQLVDEWQLAYSLEGHGSSLSTLYQKSEEYSGHRGGFVLVVKDGAGSVFGAYLSEYPHIDERFFGTGECFLWRAHVLSALPDLANLPPPPSADTTHATRMTTIASPKKAPRDMLSPPVSRSGTSTPDRMRFQAFLYTGLNDFETYCQKSFLSVGGGDGHYGLWLDDNLENGVSEKCDTFGNEPLSDSGKKFKVMGVEMWYIGS